MLTPMRSLTLEIGLKNSSLAQDVGVDAVLLGQPVEPDQGRVADRLGDRTVDPAAAGRSCRLGRGLDLRAVRPSNFSIRNCISWLVGTRLFHVFCRIIDLIIRF